MFDALYIPLSPSVLVAKISVSLGIIISALCLALCWHQWRMIRAYGRFPSKRLDVEWLLPLILGRYPKNVPITNVVFQILLKSVRPFREEGLCVIWLLKPYVVVFNEELMKNLVNEVALGEKCTLHEMNKIILGNGLLISKHEVWKVHRKLLNPAFRVGVLKSKMTSLNKYALQMVQKIETLMDEPVDDLFAVLKYCAFQNMADFVLGLELGNEKHASLAENFMKTVDAAEELIMERILDPLLYWNFTLPLFRRGKQYLKIVDEGSRMTREIMDELVKKSAVSEKEQRNDNSRVASSCGDILMKLYLQDRIFTEQDVRDHLLSFTSAGYDTVSASMLWCFYELGHHPEVQEIAFQEVQSIVPEGDVTYEDLAKMKYLDCVIKESQRLHTTIPVYPRRARKDVQCGKYVIPKGAEVCFFPFMMHRDPNNFPEPEKFVPERFYEGSKLRPWMYIPFAEGYRNCIGKRFAVMEMKVQLVHVLRRFKITSVSKIDESDLDWNIVLKPTKPLQFLFENRNSKSLSCEIWNIKDDIPSMHLNYVSSHSLGMLRHTG